MSSPPGLSRFDLTGRRALVTGSTRGIGRTLASGLAAAGATVLVNGRDPARVEQVAAEIRAAGDPAEAVAFDATDPDAVTAAITRCEEEHGPIEILVNNVGMQDRRPLEEFELAAWQRILEVNLTSAFLVGQAVARRMLTRGHGKIVNITSLQSTLARPGIAPYAATKGGLAMLTRGMCADWAPGGLQVNAIAPGYFATELTAALVSDPEFDRWLRARTPAGRWGDPEELIGAAVYLASAASDFVNGQTLFVDGGMAAVI